MLRYFPLCAAGLLLAGVTASASAGPVEFTLLTDEEYAGKMPQSSGGKTGGEPGDYLPRTGDDVPNAERNPDGCFSFNFMNPVGILEPDYPPGYAEGIHSMTGAMTLDIDLEAGGQFNIDALALAGYVSPAKPIASQRLVQASDAAADGRHGPVEGQPNSGTYSASAALGWPLSARFDWYYELPFPGEDPIDMTFDDFLWNGFLAPVSELTQADMDGVMLNDPLGYFGGTSAEFEAWLLAEVAPRLPGDAKYLLFAQGEAHPDWVNPKMGMTTDGIVGETIIAFTTVPEPATLLLVAVGLGGAAVVRRRAGRP